MSAPRVAPVSNRSGDSAMEADDPPGGRIVEHHRLDPAGPLKRSLGLGALIVSVGALIIGTAMAIPRLDRDRPLSPWARTSNAVLFEVDAEGTPVARRSSPLETALGLLGLGCVLLGGATTIIGLRRVLSEESYLALRTDGACFRRGSETSLVPWDEVEEVRWDPNARAIRFERHDGSVWLRSERFADVEGEALARRAAEIRRKALFGLLR